MFVFVASIFTVDQIPLTEKFDDVVPANIVVVVALLVKTE
jgi:hypothetical protein